MIQNNRFSGKLYVDSFNCALSIVIIEVESVKDTNQVKCRCENNQNMENLMRAPNQVKPTGFEDFRYSCL
jgi:hypothetical protein